MRDLPTSPLQRALVVLAAVVAGAVAVSVVLVHDGPLRDVPVAYGFPALGALYATTGLLAWWRRAHDRLGALLVCAGLATLVASLANTASPVLIAVGTVCALLPVSVLVHLLHASPDGRLRGPLSRATVVAAYVVGVVLQAPLWAFTPAPPPYDLLLVSARPDLASAGRLLQQVAGAAVVLATVWVLIRRLRHQAPPQRRVLAPLFAFGVLAVVAVPLVADVLTPLLGMSPERRVALQLAAVAVVPVGVLLVVLRGGFARTGELSAFVTSVTTSSGSAADLERAVGATLGDPSARLLTWSPTQEAYLDADGRPADLPASRSGRAVVEVAAGGQRLGAVVHDAQLGIDPAAAAAVGRVAAIAVGRGLLMREVTASREALREASARLLSESDRQRRGLAQDLHDGLQMSLVRLSMQAHQLADDTPDQGRREAAHRLAGDVDDAARALRALVHGVMPPPLVERGLAAAVQDLAYDLPVRTRLDVGQVPRLPAAVESTAYFVVAEALTNVLKHASARTVDVSLTVDHDVLVVDVVDDGQGGARTGATGAGLPGMRDRLDVLDGTLTITSDGGGTRLRAVLPCGS